MAQTIVGSVTPAPIAVRLDVPDQLTERIANFMGAWEMSVVQFLNAVTERGKHDLTVERVEQMLGTR